MQKNALVVGFIGAAAAVSSAANAALDPAIAVGFTGLQTDFQALMSMVYPIAIGITSALVIFGLVKMFINRAAH